MTRRSGENGKGWSERRKKVDEQQEIRWSSGDDVTKRPSTG